MLIPAMFTVQWVACFVAAKGKVKFVITLVCMRRAPPLRLCSPRTRSTHPPLRLQRRMASVPSRTVHIGELLSASLCLAKQAAEAIREIQKSGKLNIQVSR